MKKTAFILVVLFVITIGTSAFAARYDEVLTITASLSFSGNTAISGGAVTPQKNGVHSSVTVRLQRWTGSGWSTLGTWYGNGSTLIGASASGSMTIDSGTYRTWVTGTCGGETAQKYSSERVY